MSEIMGQERQVKNLKRVLDGWRMAIIPLRSVFLWEEQWHPLALVGTNLILHLLLWAMDLNFLTTVSVIGLIVNLVDFIVPIVCNSLYSGANSWNGQKEKKFEDTCRGIVSQYNALTQAIQSFYSLRETTPYLYYILSLCTLFGMAWLASALDNYILSYIVTSTAILWPGVQAKGAFNPVIAMLTRDKKA